VRPIGS
jgi:hypothetical protein